MLKEENKPERLKLIQDIESSRNSRLICYLTGDREPFKTKIADDVIPVFARHLEKMGRQGLVSVFLYTRGGDMIAPIRLIKLIHHYADQVEVIVPYRAHSAGTLIAIGANKILMGRLGELSPVDPTTGHPFNPVNPINPQLRMEISVEDLNSYFLFAKEKVGVKSEDMVEIYKQLAEKIHPLSIGNVYRAARMAQQIVEKLLNMHINQDDGQKEKIIKELTRDICIHGYPITREEAKGLGLNIEYAEGELAENIWKLYESYAQLMELKEPFNPVQILQNEEIKKFEYVGACIESQELSDKFIFRGQVKRIIKDNKSVVDLNIQSSIWE